MSEPIVVRTELAPGDIGRVAWLHGTVYAREHGFDPTFEAYVAGPLASFALSHGDRECIWLAERGAELVGCIAIVAADPETAQLRWFLVDASARGAGLGRRLLSEAVEFSRAARYRSIVLWTVSALESAARLYRAAGFELTESVPARRWGVDVVEEKYERVLDEPEPRARVIPS